jgi:excisionase family DNA binding protein
MSATQRRLVTPPSRSLEPLLLPAQDAFRLIGCGRDRGYQLIAQGRLRHVRLGRRVLVPRLECAAFVEREASQVRP